MEKHDCNEYLIAIHAEGSDARHTLTGLFCPCLPEARCAFEGCDRVVVKGGSMGLEGFRSEQMPAAHVYPAWQIEEEEEL